MSADMKDVEKLCAVAQGTIARIGEAKAEA